MGVGFTGVGEWGVAGRGGVDIDTTSGWLLEWTGWVVPIRVRRHALSVFQEVILGPAAEDGGARTRHLEYPVVITCPAGTRVVVEIRSPEEAHSVSAAIAGLLNLKVRRGADSAGR